MVTPYITFAGECRAALLFYETVFDTKVTMMQSYGAYVPEGREDLPEGLAQWVLHAEMKIADTPFWFADEIEEPIEKWNQVKLTVSVVSKKEAEAIFSALAEEAIKITLPPTETFYSLFHAGLTDKYHISWNIVSLEAPAGNLEIGEE
jgi:PhnB protein